MLRSRVKRKVTKSPKSNTPYKFYNPLKSYQRKKSIYMAKLSKESTRTILRTSVVQFFEILPYRALQAKGPVLSNLLTYLQTMGKNFLVKNSLQKIVCKSTELNKLYLL